ncbi:helix-turn-helix domain-containing protein [Streptococcus suis]|uniref:helix-turn-helix domain-containing protein n=1 Tax=Streptococcus suis TaxID=1307 RepID=UPI001914E017|nr:helix-turn-helix transcriptional regulator [Streptococcus suis]MDW8735429.1 helix-turn-helix transcriptional regulator [Streptococcus suis]WNN04506.1 helix-turn-helix transcriptional regulator [Streptococcus suis]HEM3143617.1 helix-turn-helix transcriptional regulator [Streptococcus suis]HEM3145581.1 helix-turn-helix transcriptional regulator [Streptococcus suis]HEM3405278.1 helix-turn-helix transcriptional regulator [Streptococcus suis]
MRRTCLFCCTSFYNAGKKLKEKRTELGFSQAEIARKLNISRMSFSAWESGKTKPNQKNLSILADIFDVEESFFESEYTIVDAKNL